MLRKALAGCVAVALLWIPGTAGALRASDAPTRSGGLSRPSRDCTSNVTRHQGVVAAQAQTCWFFYYLTDENNRRRDFAVMWLQGTVDPEPGWCVTLVDSDMTLPDGSGRYELTKPRSARSPNESTRTRLRLVADARGAAQDPGIVKQTYVLRPGRLRPSVAETSEGERFRVSWRGSARGATSVVSGAELSFRATLRRPALSTDFYYEIASC